ncbi:MAG: hypothetical protein U1F98_11755 [Verrucomicrobiota bacterium]
MNRRVRIAGGGLAGLALGIGLRRRGVPVTIFETGHYPRHRVCGEFISGRGGEILGRLVETQPEIVEAGLLQMFLGSRASPVRVLPRPAWNISRYELDRALAREFQRLGGELRERERWAGDASQEGIVLASGRRLQPEAGADRWFGVKCHARGLVMEADLEMHFSGRGYVGISRLPRGEFNVCGLFRQQPGAATPASRLEWLRGEPGTALRDRLEGAEWIEDSFCGVAGIALRPGRGADRTECCIGDSLTMIPPITGNGMSMALESAEFAVDPLAGWSGGGMDWVTARGRVARDCDSAFASRLGWARWLQGMVLSPVVQGTIGAVLLRSGWLAGKFYDRTR